ncbi:MAG: ABC transporter permease subunit [Aeropyrum sp.]|nr:ABC transporter permease subunit [Aeropyrum sp.]MCE4615718.1 ABC transporter permease subunit [Aeropyrum sp.]
MEIHLTITGFIVVFAAVLLTWLASSIIWPEIMPSPVESLQFTAERWRTLLSDSLITLENTVLGFTIALILAIATAWAGLAHPLARSVVDALNTIVQSVSALVWALFFLLLFGFSTNLPSIAVAGATAYPILLSGILKGFDQALVDYGEAAALIGARGRSFLRYVLLPASIPYIVASSRPALGSALRISVVAEAFGAAGGMGYRLWIFYELHEYRGFLGWALALLVMMLLLDKTLLEPLERWSRKWL